MFKSRYPDILNTKLGLHFPNPEKKKVSHQYITTVIINLK